MCADSVDLVNRNNIESVYSHNDSGNSYFINGNYDGKQIYENWQMDDETSNVID